MNDLTRLTKDQKLQLLEAVKEKKRRARSKKDLFIPHGEQRQIIDALTRVDSIYVFCGNGWGKTATGSNLAGWYVKGYNPVLEIFTKVPRKVHIILDHPTKVEDVWLPELRKWVEIDDKMLSKRGKPYPVQISFQNGSQIHFMFHEQPPMVFESTEYDVIIFDEPPPKKIFLAMKRGQRTKNSEPKTVMLGTPISQSWLRTDIYEPWRDGKLSNVECFFGNTEANRENLKEGYIEEYSTYLTEDQKKMRLQGQFFDLSGLPLRNLFKDDIHIISESQFENIFDKKRYPCVLAIDPHSAKPHHACLIGVDRDGFLYYIKEIAEKKVPREFAKELKRMMEGYRVVDIVWDSAGEAEGTGGEGYMSFSEIMKQEGIQGRGTTFKDKSDEDFVTRIQEALTVPKTPNNFGMYTPKLRIVEGNPGIVKDIKNVSWQKDKKTDLNKGKLEISNRDYLAACKYGLASNLTPAKGKERVHKPASASRAYGFGRRSR